MSFVHPDLGHLAQANRHFVQARQGYDAGGYTTGCPLTPIFGGPR